MNISSTYEMSNKIAAAGFATVTISELNQLVTELGLYTIAAKEAAKYVQPTLIDLVATNAAKRAVKQSINNLSKPTSAKELVSFLKIYSHRWATQFAKKTAKGKPLPEIDLQHELLLLSEPGIEALVESAADVELPVSDDDAEASAIAEQKKTSDLNLECFEQALRDHEFVYERNGDSIRLDVPCGKVRANLHVHVCPGGIILTSLLPVSVSREFQPGVSAGIHIANWKLNLGTFEFHEKNGTVRFRNSVPLAAVPCPAQLGGLLFSSLFAIKQHALGLIQLALGNRNPGSTHNENDNQ